MTEPSQPDFDVRGAVDLAALNRPKAPPPGTPGGAPAAGGFVIDVTEETFNQVVQASTQYPVVTLLWMPTDKANAELGTALGDAIEKLGGKVQLARVDVQASPQIAAAFQVQGVPAVFAIIQGQPIPLFQGGATPEQIRGVLGQVLAAAQQAGVDGTAPGGAEPAEAPEEPEPQLPPLHQEAYDAIQRDDLDAAAAAYEKAIKQNVHDDLAVAGLAQVRLMQRTRNMDPAGVRAAAAEGPDDIDAALDVADLDLFGGNVDDALGRLLDLLVGADADDKERLRARLVDYFEVIGSTDPRVAKARQRLAMAMF